MPIKIWFFRSSPSALTTKLTQPRLASTLLSVETERRWKSGDGDEYENSRLNRDSQRRGRGSGQTGKCNEALCAGETCARQFILEQQSFYSHNILPSFLSTDVCASYLLSRLPLFATASRVGLSRYIYSTVILCKPGAKPQLRQRRVKWREELEFGDVYNDLSFFH